MPWLKTKGGFIKDSVRCGFRPLPVESTAWGLDIFVHPEHRLGHTLINLWNQAFESMRERDIHRTMSRIDAFNLASINSHKRLVSARRADHRQHRIPDAGIVATDPVEPMPSG